MLPVKLATFLRSARALLVSFVILVVLSVGTDAILHGLGIYPPLGQPMESTALLMLALGYRTLYGVLGGYIVARLAPYAPMGHALVSGGIGLVLSTIGAIVMWNFGPNWYPIALAATALPCGWLGGLLHRRYHEAERPAVPAEHRA
jgi:hypothetical protein